MMNKEGFLWHAKRGHGICFLILQNGNIEEYRTDVKKVLLNNYAFLSNGEYRSSYACALVAFYQDDSHFLNLVWTKIIRTPLSNSFDFDYLINNLFFLLLRNKSINYTYKIKKLLEKRLNKNHFSFDETNSISSIISLILDLKLNIDVDKILTHYFSNFPTSDLDLSDVKNEYKLCFVQPKKAVLSFDNCLLTDFSLLMEHISENNNYLKEIALISYYISEDFIRKLIVELGNNHDSITKMNILKTIYYSNKTTFEDSTNLIALADKANKKEKCYLYSIISNIKSKRVIHLLDSNTNDTLFLLIALKHYNKTMCEDIKKRIKRIRIVYSDSEMWFEIEESLIELFCKRESYEELLEVLFYFYETGLSSHSRYTMVRILKKYGYLKKEDFETLKYDANYKTRKLMARIAR